MLKLAIILAAAAVYCVRAQSTYHLYTKNNPFVPELIAGHDALPEDTFLDFKDDTIILIHGHGGSPSDPFNTLTRHEILKLEVRYNVIVVDWEAEALLSYPVASSNVPLVANELVKIINDLTQVKPPLVVSKLHLVGFGLGAHVAGIAGRELRETHGIPARITGLDPAGSGWGSNSLRLRHDDADYVEVIHTDTSGPLANGIGTTIGQINFYANGGSNQPGCFSHSCSHNRAYELYAASLSNENLMGNPCSSNIQMYLNRCRGNLLKMGGTEYYKRGQSDMYRVNTGRQFPF